MCSVDSPRVINGCRCQQNCAIGPDPCVQNQRPAAFHVLCIIFSTLFDVAEEKNVLEACVWKGAGVRDCFLPLSTLWEFFKIHNSQFSLRLFTVLKSLACSLRNLWPLQNLKIQRRFVKKASPDCPALTQDPRELPRREAPRTSDDSSKETSVRVLL